MHQYTPMQPLRPVDHFGIALKRGLPRGVL
jgi:hypothetical protein